MTENTPLSDILNDEPAAEAETTEVETTEAPQETEATGDGRPRDEKGRFAPKGEKTEEAPPASEESEGNIPIAALKDERSKRQALEAELAQMRAYYAQMQQQPQPQQVQGPPDRWEDPEGYDAWLIQQAASYASSTARQEATQAYQTERVRMSAEAAKSRYPDYFEKLDVFDKMLQVNPGLAQQLYRAPDPADFAYKTAQLQMDIMQHGGIEGLVQARVKAREAELLQNAPAALPPSISSDRSVGARGGPAWGGPTPLGDILR